MWMAKNIDLQFYVLIGLITDYKICAIRKNFKELCNIAAQGLSREKRRFV